MDKAMGLKPLVFNADMYLLKTKVATMHASFVDARQDVIVVLSG